MVSISILNREVLRESTKLIRRHEEYATKLREENFRRDRRSTGPAQQFEPIRPRHWGVADGFDPYHVRKRRESTSHAIQRAIRDSTYRPRNPIGYSVPKEEGASRQVSIFQVADSALSHSVFERLMRKNGPRFSARSYAYRADLSAHDAVQYLHGEWSGRQRVFVAEYDFRKYFDSISHDHIWRTLSDQSFLLTSEEQGLIRSFLRTPLPLEVESYSEQGGTPREAGVPQGTSISLFLANVAASPLDRALEKLGVGFVRYADDTIVWSADYGQLCAAVEALFEAAELMGVELNPDKSQGVRLLVPPGSRAEIRGTEAVDFVGYHVSLNALEMKESVVARVKDRLHQLLYENLIAEPRKGTQRPERLGKVDADYSVFISQARRFLYGELSEAEVARYSRRGTPPKRFKGLMSFYPLIDDTSALQELDSWLATQTWLALRQRGRLLTKQGFQPLPAPHELSRHDLLRFGRKSATTGEWYDLSIPSFRRIARLVRAAAQQHGPNAIGRSGDPYSYAIRSYS